MKIKYKCWDKLNNRWVDLYKILFSKEGEVIAVRDIHDEQYGLHQVELVQFTDLFDKNGKDGLLDDITAFAASYHLYRDGRISKERMDKHWEIINNRLEELFNMTPYKFKELYSQNPEPKL